MSNAANLLDKAIQEALPEFSIDLCNLIGEFANPWFSYFRDVVLWELKKSLRSAAFNCIQDYPRLHKITTEWIYGSCLITIDQELRINKKRKMQQLEPIQKLKKRKVEIGALKIEPSESEEDEDDEMDEM